VLVALVLRVVKQCGAQDHELPQAARRGGVPAQQPREVHSRAKETRRVGERAIHARCPSANNCAAAGAGAIEPSGGARPDKGWTGP
jgi:hypothetical protein